MSSKEPSQSQVNSIIELYSTGMFKEALECIHNLKKEHTNEPLLYNIAGACYVALGDLTEAIKNYELALSINSNYYKAYFNLGNAFDELNQLDAAVLNYEKALDIKPDYAEAHNNLGNTFKRLNRLDASIKCFEHAIAFKPDYVEAHYSLGLTYQELERFNDAVRCYECILELKPDFAEIHNNLGVVLQELGQTDNAISHIEKSLASRSEFKEAHNNLGNILKSIGKLNEAVESYKKAISIEPYYHEAQSNLGAAYYELNQLTDAAIHYKKAIDIDSNQAETQYNLGLILQGLGKFDESILHYQKALKINPLYADAHNNLGISFKELGQLDKAIKSFEKAIQINPDYPEAYNNIGNVYKIMGRFNDSINCYQQTLLIKPDYPEAQNNLAIILMQLGKLNEAKENLKSLTQFDSDYAEAYSNLGIVLNMLGELDLALKCYDKAISIKPDLAQAYSNRGNLMIDLKNRLEAIKSYSKAYELEPEASFNLGNLIHSKLHLCIWDDLKNSLIEIETNINQNKKVVDPFPLLSLIDDPELHQKAAEIYTDDKYPLNSDLPKISKYPMHQKIRLGYFSADFRVHPVANLTAELYEIHDRNQFEIHAFSFGPDTNDEMNLRIKDGVDFFHNIHSMSHTEVVLLSRSLEIDIAIDLGGFTQDNRTGIFAMQAAPIQVNYLGYSSTMGADYIDYIIADKILIPKNKQRYYTEKIAYLPDSFMVNDTKNKQSKMKFIREEAGLPKEGFIFSCFNHHYKITPNVFYSWMKILSNVEGSILWLSDGNETGIANLKKEAKKHGINSDRLIFAPRLELREDHLNRIKLADLFLDTLPYNAHATTSDALQVGLPVLTCIGESFASRVAASLINSVGLTELITKTNEQYEKTAIDLATKPSKLKSIKDKLEKNLTTSPLYDTPLYVKQIESAYKSMYKRYQEDKSPEHIYVE